MNGGAFIVWFGGGKQGPITQKAGEIILIGNRTRKINIEGRKTTIIPNRKRLMDRSSNKT